MARIALYLTLLILCSGYAFARGGAPERAAAAMVLAAVAASIAVTRRHGVYYDLEQALFAIDLVLFLGVLGIAMYAHRGWPILMAAIDGVAVLIHAVMWMTPASVVPKVYAVFSALSAYPTLLLLAWGTYQHRKRLKMHGSDPSWSTFSRR